MCNPATFPGFIPVANTARVRLQYTMLGSQVENVLYWEGSSPWTETSLLELATQVEASWDAHFRPLQPTSLLLVRIEATSLEAEVAPTTELSVLLAGESEDLIQPGNVTLAIKFGSGLTGRSSRGRMYWLQLTENMTSGSEIESADLTAVIGAVSNFFADIEGVVQANFHVIVSYCHDNEWRANGVTTPVSSYTADQFLDSQRRRLTGRGR